MLVKTDETVARLARAGSVEKTRHEQSVAIREQIRADEASVPSSGIVLSASERDLRSVTSQFGSVLTDEEVIRRFKKLNKAIHFEVANADPTIYGVYIMHPRPIRPDGERREFVCRMERGMVPEYQVFKPKIKETPDPDIKGHTQSVMTVDDMLWGYRTVGARLIKRRVITETQMEQAFGSARGDNPRWSNATKH